MFKNLSLFNCCYHSEVFMKITRTLYQIMMSQNYLESTISLARRNQTKIFTEDISRSIAKLIAQFSLDRSQSNPRNIQMIPAHYFHKECIEFPFNLPLNLPKPPGNSIMNNPKKLHLPCSRYRCFLPFSSFWLNQNEATNCGIYYSLH